MHKCPWTSRRRHLREDELSTLSTGCPPTSDETPKCRPLTLGRHFVKTKDGRSGLLLLLGARLDGLLGLLVGRSLLDRLLCLDERSDGVVDNRLLADFDERLALVADALDLDDG